MYRGSLVNLLFIIEVLLKKNSHTSWRILKNSFGQVLSLYWFEWIGEGKWYKKSKKSYHHWFLHLVDIWNFCITLCATAAFSSNFIDGWHRFWFITTDEAFSYWLLFLFSWCCLWSRLYCCLSGDWFIAMEVVSYWRLLFVLVCNSISFYSFQH